MKYLFIDIRKSDEVYSKRFSQDVKVATTEQYFTYTIPMNMIRFNVTHIIKHLEYIDQIFIVCHSGSRSIFIKDKYFSEYENIKVIPQLQFNRLTIGSNQVKMYDTTNINVEVTGDNQFNLYSITRIIQLMLGSLIVILAGYTYKVIYKNTKINSLPLFILLLFGVMAVVNGLTSTCTISNIFINYLN